MVSRFPHGLKQMLVLVGEKIGPRLRTSHAWCAAAHTRDALSSLISERDTFMLPIQ